MIDAVDFRHGARLLQYRNARPRAENIEHLRRRISQILFPRALLLFNTIYRPAFDSIDANQWMIEVIRRMRFTELYQKNRLVWRDQCVGPAGQRRRRLVIIERREDEELEEN